MFVFNFLMFEFICESFGQGRNGSSYGNWRLHRLLFIHASCKELWDHISWTSKPNSTKLVCFFWKFWQMKSDGLFERTLCVSNLVELPSLIWKLIKHGHCALSRFHLPIAYHGRASSIVISGTNIIRPRLEVVQTTYSLYFNLIILVGVWNFIISVKMFKLLFTISDWDTSIVVHSALDSNRLDSVFF